MRALAPGTPLGCLTVWAREVAAMVPSERRLNSLELTRVELPLVARMTASGPAASAQEQALRRQSPALMSHAASTWMSAVLRRGFRSTAQQAVFRVAG